MQPNMQEARPPYVEFKLIPEEDRTASIEAGHPIMRDAEYVEITPQGSKDKLVKKADDWFAQLKSQTEEGRFPQTWLDAFKGARKAWQEGLEIPVNGTSIRSWPPASPAEIENCLRLHIRTVEDLAVANEEAIMRLGMGGRALKQRAADYLVAARDTGQLTQQVSAMRIENDALKERNKALEERLTKLEAAAKK